MIFLSISNFEILDYQDTLFLRIVLILCMRMSVCWCVYTCVSYTHVYTCVSYTCSVHGSQKWVWLSSGTRATDD